MKHLITLSLSFILSICASAQVPGDYRPLLELGKEWRYNVHDFGMPENAEPDEKMVLRLDSCFEANGITYYRMQEYSNDSAIPEDGEHAIREYLWEDMDSRTVWLTWKINEDGNPISRTVLFDFINPGNSLDLYFPENLEVTQFEAFDGMHCAYPNWDGSLMLTEALGVISYASSVYDEDTQWCTGILTSYGVATAPFAPPCASFYCRLCVLYEIADGNGELIYSVPSAYPDINAGLPMPSSIGKATITENEINIVSGSEIGTVTITSASGAVLLNTYVAGKDFTYPLQSFASGIYILAHAGQTHKFVIR